MYFPQGKNLDQDWTELALGEAAKFDPRYERHVEIVRQVQKGLELLAQNEEKLQHEGKPRLEWETAALSERVKKG